LELDLSEKPRGIYFISLIGENERVTEKVIVAD
jgi:hypothetical protein